MCDLPVEIDDEEYVVRGIKAKHHYDVARRRLKPAAFRPPAGKTAISVIRKRMGDDYCKDRAVAICGDSYIGLGVLKAGKIRAIGATVADSREEFLGHADVDHGFPAPQRDEPQHSEYNMRMVERCRELCKACRFFKDLFPNANGWRGDPLV